MQGGKHGLRPILEYQLLTKKDDDHDNSNAHLTKQIITFTFSSFPWDQDRIHQEVGGLQKGQSFTWRICLDAFVRQGPYGAYAATWLLHGLQAVQPGGTGLSA